jgi:hypothetical protein
MKNFKTDNGIVRNLNGIEIGDIFYITDGYYGVRTLVKCEKITPKQAVIGAHRYRISDGGGIGGDKWSRVPCLRLASETIMAEIKKETRVRALIQKLSKYPYSRIDLKGLEEINNIVKVYEND